MSWTKKLPSRWWSVNKCQFLEAHVADSKIGLLRHHPAQEATGEDPRGQHQHRWMTCWPRRFLNGSKVVSSQSHPQESDNILPFIFKFWGSKWRFCEEPPIIGRQPTRGEMYPNMEDPSPWQQCGTSEWCVRALATVHCSFMLREQVEGLQWDLLWQARCLIFVCRKGGGCEQEKVKVDI